MTQCANSIKNTSNHQDNDNFYRISDEELDDCENFEDDCLLEESVDNPNSVNFNIRGPYERAWTTEATRALIHIRGPMEGSFTEGRQKRTALWLHCTRQLQRMGFRYSAAKVQKKWHNILITYNKNLSKKFMSGYVHWEFFEEMFKYLQGKKANFELKQQIEKPQSKKKQLQIKQVSHGAPEEVNCQENYFSQENQNLLQPQVQLDTKSNDEFDEDSTTMSEFKQPKLEFEEEKEQCQENELIEDTHSTNREDIFADLPMPDDNSWWRNYFERKLKMEREKIELQRNMQREITHINKMSLVQQERIERLKIDAINNLTATLQRLVEVKSRKI